MLENLSQKISQLFRKTDQPEKLEHLSKFNLTKKLPLIIVVAIVAVVGTYILVRSFAESFQSSTPLVGISGSMSTSQGYWVVAADGGIFSFGSNKFYGSAASYKLSTNQQIVGMTETSDGSGYWLVQSTGGIFSYGDAKYEGNGAGKTSSTFVGMASRSTDGYWLVTSDGTIYAFGSAKYEGGTVDQTNIVGMAAADNSGYWIVGKNGGVFTYGDAKFYGSAAGQNDITNVASTPDGKGYWLIGSNGAVYPFGDAKSFGSEQGKNVSGLIISISSSPSGNGYWLMSSAGSVYAFGDATYFGGVAYTPPTSGPPGSQTSHAPPPETKSNYLDIGSVQASNHTVSYSACVDKVSASKWDVDSYASVSPTITPTSSSSSFGWKVNDLDGFQGQLIEHPLPGQPGSISSSDWSDGQHSDLHLSVDPSAINVLQYQISGTNDSPAIDLTTLNECSSPTNASTYPVYGSSRDLAPAFLGYNAQQGNPVGNWNVGSSTSNPTINPSLVSATTDLNPENLRYFGGTTANYWDGSVGNYVPANVDPSTNKYQLKPLTGNIPLSDWSTLSDASKSYPVFNLNIMTPTTSPNNCNKDLINVSTKDDPNSPLNQCELQNQISLLETAKNKYNQPIKYLELGNEFYNTDKDFINWFPDPNTKNDATQTQADVQVYAQKANDWIIQLKKDFPGVEIAVVGAWDTSPVSSPSPSWGDWNKGIAQYVNGEDAITLHIYFGTGLFKKNSKGQLVPEYEDVSCIKAYCLDQAAQMLENTANGGLSKTNGSIETIANDFGALKNTKPMPKIWLTEWNMEGKTDLDQDSWIQGLVEAQYAIGITRLPSVELSDNHGLLNNAEYGDLFDNSGYPLGGSGKTSTALDTIAGGVTLSTLLRSLKGATSTTTLSFPNAPSVASGSTAPGIIGQAFMVNGKVNLFLMNVSDSPVTINLPPSLGSKFDWLEYYSTRQAFIDSDIKDGKVEAPLVSKPGQVQGSVTLHQYSVSSLVAD